MSSNPEWLPRAACRGANTEQWFPSGNFTPPEVARICERCPVHKLCLEYAVADPELKGIWAGTSERDRARLRKLRRLAKLKPTRAG
jgi:WhiB family transcriptional regulator, redox-sensing transcriptional regulator